jgi:hypothetical protein
MAWHALATFAKLNQYIEECLGAWERTVLKHKEPDRLPQERWPFHLWDPRPAAPADRLDAAWLRLAEAGGQLFRLLFREGDEVLDTITDRLVAAHRDDEQVIVFHSDAVFAPWWLLYTPPRPGGGRPWPAHPLEQTGFLGLPTPA